MSGDVADDAGTDQPWWSEPAGSWMIYPDGSMRRLGKLSDEDREFMREHNIEPAPDFVPAEDVEKYAETMKKT